MFQFLNKLKRVISNKDELNNFHKQSNLNYHKYLEKLIISFEKAYYVRLFQSYAYDDGTDMLINFNSSLQGYISDLDSLFKLTLVEIKSKFNSESLFHDNKGLFFIKNLNKKPTKVEYIPDVISIIGDQQTESTKAWVNFDITSIFHPGILFNLITKECLVVLQKNTNIAGSFERMVDEWNNSLKLLDNSKLLKKYHDRFSITNATIEYYILELIRFKLIFNSDFELFYFWHTIQICQSTPQYEENWELHEDFLCFEISRLAFIHIIKLGQKMSFSNFAENSSKESITKFLNYNPFSRSIHKKNHILWKKWSFHIYKHLIEFISNEEVYNLFVSKFDTFIFNKDYNENDNKEVTLLKDFYNYINDSNEISSLSNVCIQLMNKYMNEIKDKYREVRIFTGWKNNTNTNSSYYYGKNKNDYPLYANTSGGLWFRGEDEELDYNRINFSYASIISHLIYKYKLLSLKEQLKAPSYQTIFE